MKLTYFILLIVSVASGILVEKPANTPVKLGEQLRLNCSSDTTPSKEFAWWIDTKPLYGCLPNDGINEIPSPYTFFAKDNGCDLIVDKATYDESQVFKCETTANPAEVASAAVAVLSVNSPSLSYVGSGKATVGSEVTVQCSIEYASSMSPSLTWTMDPKFEVINMTRSSVLGPPGQLNATITVTHTVAETYNLYCGSSFSPVDITNQVDLDKTIVTYGFETIAVTFTADTTGGNGSSAGPTVSALLFGIIGLLTLRSIRPREV